MQISGEAIALKLTRPGGSVKEMKQQRKGFFQGFSGRIVFCRSKESASRAMMSAGALFIN
jgi:hypothetical protein